jgi:signal transduction histidine kinase/DNA-binding response OmpR family regulator
MKNHLFILAAVVVASLVGMLGFTLYSDFNNALDQERARLRTLSTLIANSTTVLLERNRERMTGVNQRPEVQAMDPAQCGTLFADLRAMFPEFANVATIDLNGTAPCSAVPQPGGKPVSVAKTEWFQRALAEKRFIVGKPFIGPITGKQVSVLVEPVWGEHKELRGFLGLPLDLERFNPRIPTSSLPEGTRFGFISADGIMVWRNADQEKLIGKYVGDQEGPKLALQIRDGDAQTIGTDGVGRHYAFASIPAANWVAFSGIPTASITSRVLAAAMRNTLVGTIGLSLVGILLWFLMRRIDRVDRDLHAALEAAEAANRAKSVFLSNMSHELRTPLNAILGFAELMEHDDNIPQAQKRNLNTINRSGRHLLTLINNILDLSKIEAGRQTSQIQVCDLHELIETIVEVMELRASQKGLELNVHVGDEVPKFISTDPGKLRQILINLLSNAVKFTVHGGIDLDVSASDSDSQSTRLTLIFVVRDTGIGIADDERDRIFQPFYQSERGIRADEGTGLGLTIARQFAQLLGGDLAVASVVDKGSAFTLRLPVEVAATMLVLPPHRRVVALAQGQASRRILVVEDREGNQRLLTQLLEQVGLETRIAANGKEALEAFEAWHPHFIWMDMRMPVMDGYEATRRIRALPGGIEVKIAALTASAFREDRDAIIAAGCDDVLSKPLDEDQLFSAMERLLGLHYRYAEPSDPSISAWFSDADLAGLPADLRQELSRAAQILDEESSHRAIDRIREKDARLADELEELVRTYRYDRIVALCEGA